MTVRELYNQFMLRCNEHTKRNTVLFYQGRLKLFVARFGDRKFRSIKPAELTTYFHDSGKYLCLYLTRHTFASIACELHGLLETSKLLGHTNTATTERYVKIKRERLRKIQDDIDPFSE